MTSPLCCVLRPVIMEPMKAPHHPGVLNVSWSVTAALAILAIATPGFSELVNPGFESGTVGETPDGWLRFEFHSPSDAPAAGVSGIQTNVNRVTAREGAQFLVTGSDGAWVQQLTPAMEPDTHYHAQAETRAMFGCRAKIYFTSSLTPDGDPQAGTRFTSLDDPPFGMSLSGWRYVDTDYDATGQDAGAPLYLVLEVECPKNPNGYAAWDEVFFRQLPGPVYRAASQAKRIVVRNEASGRAKLVGLQPLLDRLEDVPGNDRELADLHKAMGTAAAWGLKDWELAEKHFLEALRYLDRLCARHPDVWEYPNNYIWVQNERFWYNWRIGKLGICKQILDRCRPVRAQLMNAIADRKPGNDFRVMLQTIDYGKWRVDRMEANFHEIAGRPAEEIAALDAIIEEIEGAEKQSRLGEANRNQHTWTCGLAANVCMEQGQYRRALSYAERMVLDRHGQYPVSQEARAECTMVMLEARLLADGPSDELWRMAHETYFSATDQFDVVRSYGHLHLIAGDLVTAIVHLDRAMELARQSNRRQYMRKTLRYRAEAKLGLGLVADAAEDLVEALTISRELADKTIEVPLYQLYGRCAVRRGIPGLAFECWNVALDLSLRLNMPHLTLDILCDIAELQADLGLVGELARTWRQIDDVLAAHPDIAAVWTARAEALRPIHQALGDRPTPPVGEDQPPSVPVPPSGQPATPESAVLAETSAAAAPAENVHLQPSAIQTHRSTGETAAASFVLFNASPAEARGTLSVHTPDLACTASQEKDPVRFHLGEAEAGTPGSCDIPLAIAPGEAKSIVVEAPPAENEAPLREIVLTWTGQRTTAARWRFGPDCDNSFTTIVDASVIQENPFYVIPFRHHLRSESGSVDRIDLSVLASRACRIEYYDAETQTALAIDATGDGRFDERGDALLVDDDESGYPDVVFTAEGSLKPIELWVYPVMAGIQPGDETELTLSVFRQGEWVSEAVDILIHADTRTP